MDAHATVIVDADTAADIADADAFEELIQANGLSTSTIPNQQVIDNTTGQQIEIKVGNEEVTVIIDQFPSGNPGAPLAMLDDVCRHETRQEAEQGDSMWAPFLSQCDWAFTCWAKMHGPTLTSVLDLLAIPEVFPSSLLFILSLIHG